MSSGAEHEASAEHRGGRLTSDQRVDLIRDGLATWREGFLAYLLVPGIDLSDPDLVGRYTDCYAGWYPDRQALMSEQINVLGWDTAIEDFIREHDLPAGALDLDWDRIWGHCLEIYSVVEQLGGVHIFTT